MQGPLKGTVLDFWRAVWDYNTPAIVMLTNLMEKTKSKCAQYWPNSEAISYGPFSITLTNTTTLADYVIRDLTVKNVRANEILCLNRQYLNFFENLSLFSLEKWIFITLKV